MSFGTQLKKDFSTITLALMVVAIVLNIVVGQIVGMLKLPVFLDSIGTVLVALLAGPWAGALTGFLSNVIWGLVDPTATPFAPVALVIGLVAGLCAQFGLFKQWWQAIISGIIITIALSPVAVFIVVAVYGGVTGAGADFITAYFLAVGQGLIGSTIISVFTSNLVDKVVTALLGWAIVKGLATRFVARFPRASVVQS